MLLEVCPYAGWLVVVRERCVEPRNVSRKKYPLAAEAAQGAKTGDYDRDCDASIVGAISTGGDGAISSSNCTVAPSMLAMMPRMVSSVA